MKVALTIFTALFLLSCKNKAIQAPEVEPRIVSYNKNLESEGLPLISIEIKGKLEEAPIFDRRSEYEISIINNSLKSISFESLGLIVNSSTVGSGMGSSSKKIPVENKINPKQRFTFFRYLNLGHNYGSVFPEKSIKYSFGDKVSASSNIMNREHGDFLIGVSLRIKIDEGNTFYLPIIKYHIDESESVIEPYFIIGRNG